MKVTFPESSSFERKEKAGCFSMNGENFSPNEIFCGDEEMR